MAKWIIQLIAALLLFTTTNKTFHGIPLILFTFGSYYFRENKKQNIWNFMIKTFCFVGSPFFIIMLFILGGLSILFAVIFGLISSFISFPTFVSFIIGVVLILLARVLLLKKR